MTKIKNKYLLIIIILFISINIIPISVYLLTKNEYFFSFSLIPIVLIILFFLKLPILDKFNKINYLWGIFTVIFPLFILFIISLFVYFFDKNTNINIYYFKTSNFIITFLISFIFILFTEEALFRGIFWFFFEKLEYSLLKKNFIISTLFVLWHIPIIILFPDFHLYFYVTPIYFLNVFFLSFNFGFLRYFSNSLLFISICHSIWNTLVYEFFGYGKIIGSWEIKNYLLFDPERGIISLLFQLIITTIFIYKVTKSKKS